MKSKTIVFIHGMYMTPLCWENWLNYFQTKDYHCIAPAWPGRDKPVETLRKSHPDPQLGSLTLSQVIEHYASLIKNLDEQPILIGHSMGGLVAQLLLQKYAGIAGVAIDSAPPKGVFTTKLAFLKSNWPHINPFVSQGSPIQMTLERFQYTFVNDLPPALQKAAFERYVVPESRRVPAQSLTKVAAIDFSNPHPALLLVAGSNDHLIPASLNQTNFKKYKNSPSITDFKEFAGRTHFTIGQPGWEEVAGYIATWLEEKAG
ncbi:MAG: alpha/beta hydrolase [Anaerolineales bacterium]|jgi:pimeloyl-ACP methyl ester carboxylesterase